MSAAGPLRAVAGVDLRDAAARWPSPVALVTVPGGDALVVDSLVSASLAPPLVAFSPSRTSLTWRRMRAAGRFAVNVLALRHAGDLRERARPGADRLQGLDVAIAAGGVPVLRDAAVVLECVLEAEHPAGDHTIVLGRVEAVRTGGDDPPLVSFDRRFATVTD